MLLSKCEVCDSKKWKFIKEQEATGILSSLGIKTSVKKIFPSFVLRVLNKLIQGMKRIK